MKLSKLTFITLAFNIFLSHNLYGMRFNTSKYFNKKNGIIAATIGSVVIAITALTIFFVKKRSNKPSAPPPDMKALRERMSAERKNTEQAEINFQRAFRKAQEAQKNLKEKLLQEAIGKKHEQMAAERKNTEQARINFQRAFRKAQEAQQKLKEKLLQEAIGKVSVSAKASSDRSVSAKASSDRSASAKVSSSKRKPETSEIDDIESFIEQELSDEPTKKPKIPCRPIAIPKSKKFHHNITESLLTFADIFQGEEEEGEGEIDAVIDGYTKCSEDDGSESPIEASSLRLALHPACEKGNIDDVKAAILEDPTRLEEKDSLGRIPLHCACKSSSLTLVQWLIEQHEKHGVDIEQTDEGGNTALHCAGESKSNAIFKYLLHEKGFDPYHLNKSDRAPFNAYQTRNTFRKLDIKEKHKKIKDRLDS